MLNCNPTGDAEAIESKGIIDSDSMLKETSNSSKADENA